MTLVSQSALLHFIRKHGVISIKFKSSFFSAQYTSLGANLPLNRLREMIPRIVNLFVVTFSDLELGDAHFIPMGDDKNRISGKDYVSSCRKTQPLI